MAPPTTHVYTIQKGLKIVMDCFKGCSLKDHILVTVIISVNSYCNLYLKFQFTLVKNCLCFSKGWLNYIHNLPQFVVHWTCTINCNYSSYWDVSYLSEGVNFLNVLQKIVLWYWSSCKDFHHLLMIYLWFLCSFSNFVKVFYCFFLSFVIKFFPDLRTLESW